MGQALYRKYRTKTFADTVGQEHVTKTLENAVKQGKISHAYLLSGPRGVGKTSIARILAHEINGLPYDDAAHLDIIEIDAASNRRIDEIRDLRDRVNVAPASAKYKVYIIDEVHMLTKEAFNALLKTLEEPPAHVVFILATTEAHKLPETIISRTQRYTLRPVPKEQVVAHLRTIASGEKLTIDDEALELIAEHGEGSFRDSISLLDQASGMSDHITRDHITQMLGLAPHESVATLLDALRTGQVGTIVDTLAELQNMGYEAPMIARQLSVLIRNDIIAGTSPAPASELALLERLLSVPAAREPKQLLEIILLQSMPHVEVLAVPTPQPVAPKPTTTPKSQAPAPQPPKKPEAKAATKAHIEVTPEAPAAIAAPVGPPPEDVTELWQQTLDEIKKQYNTLYGIARMAQPQLQDNKLVLTFKFAFHQKRINEPKNRKLFATVIEKLYGSPLEITCVVAEPETIAGEKPDINAISNIFGGAELLES